MKMEVELPFIEKEVEERVKSAQARWRKHRVATAELYEDTRYAVWALKDAHYTANEIQLALGISAAEYKAAMADEALNR